MDGLKPSGPANAYLYDLYGVANHIGRRILSSFIDLSILPLLHLQFFLYANI